MKLFLNRSLAFAAAMLLGASANAALLVTGVFDGPLSGGLPKVIELYAESAIPDLSKYGVGAANNGGGTDGVELVLSGSASAGDFIYIADTGNPADPSVFSGYFGFTPALLFDGNFATGGAASVNGDDAVEVFFDATGAFSGSQTVVDVFGEITHSGPGAWNYQDGWAYRKDNTGPDGSIFEIDNWTFSGINATDGQTSNSSGSIFPIGSYQGAQVPEPSAVLLTLAGLASIAGVRRRNRG